MLPVIVAAADDQALLGPDDLGADGEALRDQALGDRRGVQRAVPDIGDVAGEQRPGRAPVGAIVVLDLAAPCGLVDAQRDGARPDRIRRHRADR